MQRRDDSLVPVPVPGSQAGWPFEVHNGLGI
jgi:hypothetical protein